MVACRWPTNDKSCKEGVDPAHNEGLWDHHRHVSLHHVHHAVHRSRVGHRIRRRLAPSFRPALEKATILVPVYEVAFACLEGGGRQDGGAIIAEVHAAHYGLALARFQRGGGGFGWGCKEDCCVVA